MFAGGLSSLQGHSRLTEVWGVWHLILNQRPLVQNFPKEQAMNVGVTSSQLRKHYMVYSSCLAG